MIKKQEQPEKEKPEQAENAGFTEEQLETLKGMFSDHLEKIASDYNSVMEKLDGLTGNIDKVSKDMNDMFIGALGGNPLYAIDKQEHQEENTIYKIGE